MFWYKIFQLCQNMPDSPIGCSLNQLTQWIMHKWNMLHFFSCHCRNQSNRNSYLQIHKNEWNELIYWIFYAIWLLLLLLKGWINYLDCTKIFTHDFFLPKFLVILSQFNLKYVTILQLGCSDSILVMLPDQINLYNNSTCVLNFHPWY